MNKKIKNYLSKKQGSILAYSLIVIAAMLAIVGSFSVVSIIEKKGSSGTEFSTQSLQTADSGVQLALKKIMNSGGVGTIGSVFPACNSGSGKVEGNDAGPGGSLYELTFFDNAGVAPLSCSANISEVANIKSVGTYKNTVRAVNVAVAATSGTGYQLSCFAFNPSSGANYAVCCRLDNSTGATACKTNTGGGAGGNWTNMGTTSGGNSESVVW